MLPCFRRAIPESCAQSPGSRRYFDSVRKRRRGHAGGCAPAPCASVGVKRACAPHSHRSRNHLTPQAVKRLIKQTGIKNDFDVTYNPDGIRVSLIREQSRFIIALRWSA
nr:hypothetical protein [Bacillus velezensis]